MASLPEFDTVETDSKALPDFGGELPDFGDTSPVQAPDLSGVKLSPYEQATMDRGGIKPKSGMESGTELTTAVASDPVGFAKSIPSIAGGVMSAPGRLAYAGAADLVSKGLADWKGVSGDKEPGGSMDTQYGGNLAAMMRGEDQLPADKLINSAAQSAPNLAVGANIAKSIAEMAPLMGMSYLPAAINRIAAGAFSLQMIAGVKDTASELGTELGLPADQQDAGKIARLKSDLIQTGVFAPLAGAGALSRPVEVGLEKARAHSIKRLGELYSEEEKRLAATEPPTSPLVAPVAPAAAAARPSVTPALPGAEAIFKSTPDELRAILGVRGVQGDNLTIKLAKEMTEDQLKQAEPFILELKQREIDAKKVMDEEIAQAVGDTGALEAAINKYSRAVSDRATKGKVFLDVFTRLNRPLPEAPKPAAASAPAVKPEIVTVPGDAAPPAPAAEPTPAPAAAPPAASPGLSAPVDISQPVKPESKPAAPEKGMEAGQLGGGAAELGEVGTGAGADVMGVRQKTREQQAAAGQPVVSQPGEGTSLNKSLMDGRIALDRDPASADRIREQFDRTNRFNEQDFGIARAKYEQVMEAGRRIEEKFGTNSAEYHAARMEAFTWSDLTKRMQTEWAKSGMAQQGATDIDTGSLIDIETDYHDKTGKEFTPGQRKQGTRIAKTNKDAQDATGKAQTAFNNHIRRRATTDAEKAAFDAANKTVREWAITRAEAENKARVANEALKQATDKVQADAAARAAAAGSKTVREADIRAAQAENKARVDAAKRAVDAAEVQRKASQKAEDAANKTVREAAAAMAAKERKLQGDPTLRVWTKAKEYLDKGIDKLDDIRKKLATDLGMSIEQVTRLIGQDKRAKWLADDLWRKQQTERNLKSQAKRWVQELSTPGLTKALNRIPRLMFTLKVGLHGTVALGTHAPTVAFQPRFWNAYVRNFAKMYKMVGVPTPKGQARARAYYENQVQDLLRRDTYIPAQRGGLVNNPFVYEEYAMNPVVGGIATISPKIATAINNMTGMGNRGYSVLKILRQDMFDQHWNQLPKTMQIPEIAKSIADGVNHATGVVQGMAPPGTNLALFAPRLEASRVMWLAGDPGKAVGTLLNWKNASMGEKHFAMNQLKEKAWVMGTVSSLLALNQGILSATGSDQKVNVTDPFKPDFLKFKVAGMNVSYGNPMITMARLPLRLFVGIVNEGKLNKIVYEDERVSSILFEYVRSQMSPFAGTATDLALGRDFMERPLPRAAFGLIPGKTNIPKRLKAEGIQPYTWAEYATQQAAMIPLQEALKEVWGKDLMMSPESREHSLKAFATIIVMMGTGSRVTEDYSLNQKPAARAPVVPQF